MHHKAGDRIVFTCDGWEHKGIVKAATKNQAVILANREHYLRTGQTFRQLLPHEACNHCGGFICTSDCPSKPNQPETKTPDNMTSLPFSKLADKEDGDAISQVEGVLTKIWDAKKGKTGKGSDYCLQNGELKEEGTGLTTDITFASANHEQPKSRKGCKLRITCHEGEKGKSGVYMKQEEYKGKTTRKLWVTATAEVVDINSSNGASQERSQAQETPDGGRQASDAAPSRSVQSRGTPAGNGNTTTVHRRALCYFGVMSAVMKAKEEAIQKGATLPDLSVTDLKDIATHLSMTYRGDYGCYAEPFFGEKKANGTSERELAEMPEKTWEGDQSTDTKPKVETWKDVLHKSGIKLGEAPVDKLKEWALWAIKAKNLKGKQAPKEGTEAHRFMLHMLTAAAEKGWTAKSFLLQALAGHEKYNEGFADADVERHFGCKFTKLSEDKAEEYLAQDLDELVEEVITSIPEETQDDSMPD